MDSITKICMIRDCNNRYYALGWCENHYAKMRRTGSPLGTMQPYFKHGMWGTPEYRAWKGMIYRCTAIHDKSYKDYGGRGIKVCERWKKSFLAFYNYVGERPSPKHSLDRINNEGNYEPGNIRWATKQVQVENRRCSRLFTINNRTQSIAKWAKELEIPYPTMYARYFRSKKVTEEKTKRSVEICQPRQ